MEGAWLGECNYYLKARFPTAERATAAVPRLSELLGQGEAARDYWQNSRPSWLREGGRQPPSAEVFWAGFRERFPLVYRYLRELADTPDWNNGLAGQLSCMVDPRVPQRGDPRASLIQERDTLLLKLSGIWHFAEMGRLERYCLEDLGAVAAGSISEEDLERYDDEEAPEDWEFFEAIEMSN
jgi:hypothetical protein